MRANGREYTGLVFGSGDEWRSARHTVSPAFSTRKMKLVCLVRPGTFWQSNSN